MQWRCNFPRWRECTGQENYSNPLKKVTYPTYSCDGDLILPWYLDLAPLFSCTIAGIVRTIMIIVVPRKVAIDEASNRDGTQLDEAKKEEQVKTGFLPSAPRSGHFNHRK